uniref:Uncharacterized protein n=1 Tax=Anguilla anguilla TaxID=7936 RepID=A0A0E9RUV1_ANGAN
MAVGFLSVYCCSLWLQFVSL